MLESAAYVERRLRSRTVEPVARMRAAVAGPADAARVVDSLAALGVDFIKIRTVASRETFQAIAAAARRAGLPLVGHATFAPQDLLAAGQRSLEHVYPALLTLPDSTRRRVLADFAAAGVAFVPTLVNGEHSLYLPDSTADALMADSLGRVDPRRRYVRPYLLAEWREELADRRGDRRDWSRLAPLLLGLQREARAAGVRILPGSDLGVAFMYP